MNLTRAAALADAVLAYVLHLEDADDLPVLLDHYRNGPEVGYELDAPAGIAVWSNYHNTGQIVVYVGRPKQFTMDGTILDAAVYDGKKLFDWNDAAGAAEYICQHLELVAYD